MAKNRSNTRVTLEVEKHRNITTAVVKILRTFFIVTGFVLCSFIFLQIVIVLAGKTTLANIGINLQMLADIKLPEFLGGLFGLSGIGYGLVERNFRKSKIKKMAERIQYLEQQIDPSRTSSGLDAKGNTRRSDR